LTGGGADWTGETEGIAGGLWHRVGVDLRHEFVGLAVGVNERLGEPRNITDKVFGEGFDPDGGHRIAARLGVIDLGEVLDDGAAAGIAAIVASVSFTSLSAILFIST
jgi:hypothetical protein